MGVTLWGDNGMVVVHDFFHTARMCRPQSGQCRMAGKTVVEWSHANKRHSGVKWKHQEMAVGLAAGFSFSFFTFYLFIYRILRSIHAALSAALD